MDQSLLLDGRQQPNKLNGFSSGFEMETLTRKLQLEAEERFSLLHPEVRDVCLRVYNKNLEQVQDELKTIIDEKKAELRSMMKEAFEKEKYRRQTLMLILFRQELDHKRKAINEEFGS
ncbi:hypothetical protein QR680_018850 [Steinernema hermaphroditum]|uniref:Uncharacterized protein n=1 Tax=Steinernema hermaphroditum TaxID=289476 RepID=A0AA39HK57_9BILA|nr:hypothetical protein QR680_018850 [Steinernema hermaphroditum]